MVNPGFESPENSADQVGPYNNDKKTSGKQKNQNNMEDEENLHISGLPDNYSPRPGTLSTQKGLIEHNRSGGR